MTGYLGLGSNLGDRRANLRAALDLLPARGVTVTATSSVYETEPQGELTEQPDFLNMCAHIETELAPLDLVDACKAIERELGRRAGGPRHGPRPIDLDVLLLGALEHSSRRLRVPHPAITTRRFVLEPLLELDPGIELPDGTRLADVAARVRDQRVSRVGVP